MRERVYIAGKITLDKGYREKFERAQAKLEAAGMIVLNPAILPEGFSYDAYMRMSGAMLAECDAVCMLPGWTHSKGAVAEYNAAMHQGKRIFLFEVWEWERYKHKPPMMCGMWQAMKAKCEGRSLEGMCVFAQRGRKKKCKYCSLNVVQANSMYLLKQMFEREAATGGCDHEHQGENRQGAWGIYKGGV